MNTSRLLSIHEVKATFKGIRREPCRFLTSLCPDKCNHSKDVATFAVDQYIEYAAHDKYCDEKQGQIFYAFGAEEGSTEHQSGQFDGKIKALTPGDKVILRYEHRYVTGTGNYPIRPFTKLERI